MAFLSKQPGEDDENAPQQQAATPTLGGGASASPMTGGGGGASSPAPTMGGGASAAPQKSAMQGTGSNFTNLSSFLTPTVAKQNTEKVQTMGAQLGAAEKQTFNKAADPLRNASFNAVQGNTRELVNNLVPQSAPVDPNAGVPPGGYKDPNTGQIWGPKDPKTGARTAVGQGQSGSLDRKQQLGTGTATGPTTRNRKEATPATPAPQNASLTELQSMLTQDYNGPMSVDYDANNKNAQQWSQLGNADTAINAMAPGNFTENLPSPQYGQGNRWLDEALIKGDVGTIGAIGESKKASEAFGTKAGEEAKALGEKATGFKAQAADEREKRKGELKTYGDEMLGGIDSRATAANNENSYNMTTGDASNAQWIDGGSPATKENVATKEERGRLSEISKLLGVDNYNVKDGGTYRGGHWEQNEVKEQSGPKITDVDPNSPTMDNLDKIRKLAVSDAEKQQLEIEFLANYQAAKNPGSKDAAAYREMVDNPDGPYARMWREVKEGKRSKDDPEFQKAYAALGGKS